MGTLATYRLRLCGGLPDTMYPSHCWTGINLLATLVPQEPKNGKLKIKQYAKYIDSKARQHIAREMIRVKKRVA